VLFLRSAAVSIQHANSGILQDSHSHGRNLKLDGAVSMLDGAVSVLHKAVSMLDGAVTIVPGDGEGVLYDMRKASN